MGSKYNKRIHIPVWKRYVFTIPEAGYRLICEIREKELIILALSVGHR